MARHQQEQGMRGESKAIETESGATIATSAVTVPAAASVYNVRLN